MISGFSGDIKKIFLSLLVLIAFSISAHSQVDTIINKYTKVLTRSSYQITVDNAADFNAGDYVLLIQMKGVSINSDNAAGYGDIADVIGKPGQYEFLKIDAKVSNTITFLSKIKNYDPTGYVQLVKVPFVNSLTVSSGKKLTCPAWNPATGTGGVLAVIVGKTLKLNGDIDVTGKGFKGGQVDLGDGICSVPSGINDTYYFTSAFSNAGYKGEGIASHYKPGILSPNIPFGTQLYKGKGAMFNGGGGGNGRFSGGGGGSNRGFGNTGGLEDYFCSSPDFQGDGGERGFNVVNTSIDTVSNTGGVFMGGGGGSSTYLSGANATPGGNGGGIIIIISDAIEGNGKAIIASGDSARTATNIYSGAGGGGAGGSIMIFSQNYSTTDLFLKVNGSKGGDVYHDATANGGGTGGAGGGGYIGLLKPETFNVNVNLSGGGNSSWKTVGFPTEAQVNSGDPGLLRAGVLPVLTGFLFNSISSEVTGNQIDSTCSDTPFGKIIGTSPVGGTIPYAIQWQSSIDGTNFSDISGQTALNYTPGSLSVTTWFRRVVSDNSAIKIIDESKPVKVIVHQKIDFNIIVASPDTICINTDPQLIKQGTPDLFVPTTKYLKYIWQDSTVGGTWGATLAPDNLKEFDPDPSGGLTKDTWYRRTVKSGACIDKSGVAVIRKLDLIADNAFSKLNDTICFGGNTNLATIAGPTGGVTGKYKYQWESSISSTTGPWTPIAGEIFPTFDPDASVSLPVGDHFYRRIVYSGELNTCKDITPAATRKVWPVIANNKIKADQTIGYDSIPAKLLELLTPSGGAGSLTYKYKWLKDTIAYPVAPGPNSNLERDYQPPNLRWTISFKRILKSSSCTDTSNSVKITVDALITNTIALDNPALDTIYTGYPSTILKGSLPTGGSGVANDYSFQWYKSVISGTAGWSVISGEILPDFDPGILTQNTWFRRDVGSPKLSARAIVPSNPIKIEVLPKIQNYDITASQTICSGDQPAKLLGNTLISGGDGEYRYTWQDSTSLTGWDDITSYIKVSNPDYTPPVLTSEARYRRIVYSGKADCASETSKSVKITVNILPTGTITNLTDTTICGDGQVLLKLNLTGAPGYKITYNDGFTDGPADITVAGNSGVVPVNPSSPSALNTYTYKLVNVTDQNGCIALISSLNGTKKANVYKVPVANAGEDDIFCGPKVTLYAVPSVGTGMWTFPPEVTLSDATSPNSDASFDPVLFTGKDLTSKFVWEETNWQCKNKDSVNVTFDRPVVKVDAGKPDTTFYTIDNIIHMTGNIPEAWETGTWSVIAGSGIFANDTIYNTTVEGLGAANTYRWTIKNGTCFAEDEIIVNVSEIIVPRGISPNSGDEINNVLEIKGLDLQNQDAELRILTGSGSEVYFTYKKGEKTDTWKNWDGKNSKGADLPDGTYYFVLKLTSKNPGSTSVHKETGYIILKRNQN